MHFQKQLTSKIIILANRPVLFVGSLTLVMTVTLLLQIAFSLPTWEGSGTHLRVVTHSLRSPALQEELNINLEIRSLVSISSVKIVQCHIMQPSVPVPSLDKGGGQC